MVRGYKLEFTSDSIQNERKRSLQFSLTDTNRLEAEITALSEKGAITKVTPVSDQFVSTLFLVPKNGSSRPVINLRDLKCPSPLRPLQNGRHSSLARHTAPRKLVRKTRSKRRVFCNTHLGESQEISPLSVERLPSRVCMSSLFIKIMKQLWLSCVDQAFA